MTPIYPPPVSRHPSQPRARAGVRLTGDRFGTPVALKGTQDRGEGRIEATRRCHVVSDTQK